MKALLLSHDFPPMGGGIARALGEIVRHAPAGSLSASTGRVPGSEPFDAACAGRVHRVTVPSERLRTWHGLLRWAWQARPLVRDADFLWAGNLKPAGHVARRLGRRAQVPYGLMVYGLDLQLLLGQLGNAAKRRRAAALVRDAAGIVAISHWTAERCRAVAAELRVDLDDSRLRVVPLGVDTDRFRPGVAGGVARRRYGLDDRPWLLTVARLVPHKGVDLGLEVLRALHDGGHVVGYAIAGDGPDRDRLARRAAELGVADAVRWLGPVPEADLPAVYASATVYLGLSREAGNQVEGFGLALLEAQASGLPVVAGRGGGTADAVLDGTTGWLVDPLRPEPAVAAVRALLEAPGAARAMAAAGRARVERGFTWGRVVADLAAAAAAFRSGRGSPGGR